jgi:hypothetical protein
VVQDPDRDDEGALDTWLHNVMQADRMHRAWMWALFEG